MTFGEKFKAEREKRKLTQQEVADALGINRRMITRYENGILSLRLGFQSRWFLTV